MKKLLLLVSGLFIILILNGQTTIIPIPVSTEGNGDPNIILALYIVLNIICLLILFIRSIQFVICKPFVSFYKYITDFDGFGLITFNAYFFIVTNIIAIIIYLVSIVHTYISSFG